MSFQTLRMITIIYVALVGRIQHQEDAMKKKKKIKYRDTNLASHLAAGHRGAGIHAAAERKYRIKKYAHLEGDDG